MNKTPTNPHDRHLWQFQWVRDLFVLASAFLVLWLGDRLAVITVPLLVALMLAYCCEPLVSRLARWFPRLGRTGSAVALLSTALVTVLIVLSVIVVPVVTQSSQFISSAPAHLARAEDYLTNEKRPAWLRDRAIILTAPLKRLLESDLLAPEPVTSTSDHGDEAQDSSKPAIDAGDDSTSTTADPSGPAFLLAPPADTKEHPIRALAAKLFGTIGRIIGGTTSTIIDLGFFAVILIFTFVPLSASFPHVAAWFQGLMPERTQRKAAPLIHRMDQIVSGFIRGRLITAGILALVYAIGWTVCGVPYAIVLGICTGVASLVPYLAAVGLPIAWALLAVHVIGSTEAGFYVTLASDGSIDPIWWKILVIPAIVNAIAQSLEDYVLTPLIQGQVTQLHPVAIMLAIIAGGTLAGLYGMILAVPIAACAKVMLTEVVGPRLRQWAAEAAGPATMPVTKNPAE